MDITDVRAQNVKKILDALLFTESLTKKEIALLTGLSFSTVSPTCNELREKGLLREVKTAGASVGRLPGSFSFLKERFVICCVDMQADQKLGMAVVDLSGSVIFAEDLKVDLNAGTAGKVQAAAGWYKKFLSEPMAEDLEFVRVCIAVTGVYDDRVGMLRPNPINPLPMPLRKMAQDAFGLPCLIDSGSNFCAMAMKLLQPEKEDFIYLHFSGGVNAGIYCRGALLRGHSRRAGSVGYLPMTLATSPFDPSADCPNADLSMPGMLQNFPDAAQEGTVAERWDDAAAKLLAFPGRYEEYLTDKASRMGSLLVWLVDLFDPSVVYLGGKSMAVYDLLEPKVQKILAENCPLSMESGLTLVHDTSYFSTLRAGMAHAAYSEWRPLAE